MGLYYLVWNKVIYYTRPNGRQPAAKWIRDQDNSIKPSIDVRIEKLDKEGLLLKDTKMLVHIKGKDSDFYELKCISKKWRIATYYDRKQDIFVLLWGWRRTQPKQESEIEKARTLLHEYLECKGGNI